MNQRLSVIYPYRNRDTNRVERSLESLCHQEYADLIEIIFVDFGSDEIHQEQIKNLLKKFPSVHYVFNHTLGMPWSRSHALNTGIKLASSDYIFTADVDMIFSRDFSRWMQKLMLADDAVFFTVGYLPEKFNFSKPVTKSDYQKSETYALGLALISKRALTEIGGYDEFFCFWGLEDNDIHARLQNAGYKCSYFGSDVLLYHQWHPAANTDLPDGWRTCMGEYFEAMKSVPVRNMTRGWGHVFTSKERTAWNALNNALADAENFTCRKVFFEWQLKNKLDNAVSRQTIAGTYTDVFSERYLRAKPGKTAGVLKSLFSALHIPVHVNTAYADLFMTTEQARNSFFYFVHFNRNQIYDYAFRSNEKGQLEFAFTKI